MAISVNEYIKNKDLLEKFYIPYAQKMDLVDTILDNVIDYDVVPAKLDSALLKAISIQVFIQNLTNIDLSEEQNDGVNGYDILCNTEELQGLLNSIAPEYRRLEEILNDKVNDFYRNEYSAAKALNDIREEVFNGLAVSADYIENALKEIDVEKIAKMMPKAGVVS